MTITEDARGFSLQFDYRPYIVAELKKIPGVRFQGKERGWFVPLYVKKKNESGAEITIYNREPMEKFKKKHVVNAEGFDAAEQLFKINELPELTIDIPWRKGVVPYPYQGNGIARGLELKRFINADMPGLGKTIQSIGTILAFKEMGINPFPCLVICPPTLKENWRREIEDKFSNRKAIILDAKTRANWHSMVRMNMADFIITNYESLWSHFITGVTTKGAKNPTLKEMLFDPRKDLFKSVIIDELHKCFVYETPILTNKGWLPIGYICENKIPDLYAMSCNLSSNVVSLKKITNYWINELRDRELYHIGTNKGGIICTGDHEIYNETGRKQMVSSFKTGDNLLLLREENIQKVSKENNEDVLQQFVCEPLEKFSAGYQSENGPEQESNSAGNNMRLVQNSFQAKKEIREKGSEILHTKLRSEISIKFAGKYCQDAYRRKKRNSSHICHKANGKSTKKKIAFRSNENQQPNVGSGMPRACYSETTRQDIFKQRGKRETYGTSKKSMRSFRIACRKYGMGNKNTSSLGTISKFTKSLQSRHSCTRNYACNRSGWPFSYPEKMEVPGQKENRNIECVRVESCEIYQPRNIGDIGYGSIKTQRVYDIEVQDNHNYFANGILVSNCKDPTTRQSKVAKGLTAGKEIVIGLTGTPVVNKPKDLLSQLSIINQLHQFGGWKYFNDRYCQGGTGAAFLNELNGKLNNICFFRREKKDVLKDLPDKVREVFTRDITTQAEYNKAKNDLGAFLKDQGYSEKQVNKSLNAEIMVKIGVLKSISARGKLPEAIEHIQEVVDAGEKIVVFIHQKFMANTLMAHFPGSVCVRGKEVDEETGKERPQSIKMRQAAVDAFQMCKICNVKQENHDSVIDHEYIQNDVNIMFASIKAGGVGITLTAASRLIFLELPWHPADVEQCEDRIHRIGQKNAAQISYFLGKNTIDEDIYKLIEAKRGISDAITGTTTSIDTIITDLTRSLFNQK